MKTLTKTLMALSMIGSMVGCKPFREDQPQDQSPAVQPAPAAPFVWGDAPVILSSSVDYSTGEQHAAEQTTVAAVSFAIPDAVYVRTGNAANGQAQFQFRTAASVSTCTYQGGLSVAHPTTDLDRMHGRRYLFAGCDGGQQAGQTASSTWFSLRVLGGDAQDPAGMTSASLHLGGGCSDPLPAPIAADEVVAMRDGFSWQTIAKLPETDVDGYPAMFHGLIYIDQKAQLAALDRMKVFWSAQPISERYMSGLRGKCGRVEHATDGRGMVVYAVFPARLFNVMRDFALQAIGGDTAPPFKFIIPSPPDQPEYVNADGSIKYSALGSSGFGAWLASRTSQQPSWYDVTSWPGDISDAATDAYDWAKDHVVDPAAHYGEYGFDYLVNGFDSAIDWTANFLNDVWTQSQQILGDFVGLFSDKVTLRLNVTMLNRDSQFSPAGGTLPTLTRMWGPNDAGGNRPKIVPAGAHVQVKQWGWGFLPIMDQQQLSETGDVTLRAVKGDSGRSGDLCIELATDYAMITSDFVPNEVCDFASGKYGNFAEDVPNAHDDGHLNISQADLFGLTQIKDSADYFKTVEGAAPYTFNVLTGWVANEITTTIAGRGVPRAMTLCLNFPGTGASLITSTAGVLGAAGELTGTGIGSIASSLAVVGASLIEKDLWWPDSDADARDSRGVITHEYGHFTMCSLLFAQNGPPGLTGLISRVFEGQNDSRGDEVALMTESWADTFAMQVTGGTNYIQGLNATSGGGIGINFCTASPCMDANYAGTNDYPGRTNFRGEEDFYDELARYETLMQDAFDRSDSSQWFKNAPSNGDVWVQGMTGLVVAPAPYIANADENVSLPGTAWQTWVKHWLERGLKASPANVVGGLVDTMTDQGYNWCDRCELLALHDKTTNSSAYDQDPTGHGAPTFPQRYERWVSCVKSPDIKTWLGPAPATNLSIDATCSPCPLHNFVDANGACQPCPAGSISVGDQCYPCEYGAASNGELCIIG